MKPKENEKHVREKPEQSAWPDDFREPFQPDLDFEIPAALKTSDFIGFQIIHLARREGDLRVSRTVSYDVEKSPPEAE